MRQAEPSSNQSAMWSDEAFEATEFLFADYRDFVFPAHLHETFAIGVIEAGGQRFRPGRAPALVMPAGTLCAINPGVVHEGLPATEHGWRYRMFYPSPVAMEAFRAGVPGNGKPFPDGAKLAKIEWKKEQSPDAPYEVKVPSSIYVVEFMVKDSKRFQDGNGWGYAVFKWDAASKGYAPAGLDHVPPQANDAKCGVACHTIAKGKNYVFTTYARR
jgi:Cytochrome P460/AraC-like ligand binding domain